MTAVTNPQIAAIIALIDDELRVDRSAHWFGYPMTRALKELRTALSGNEFPRTFEQRLHLSLIPVFQHEARAQGVDWASPDAPLGEFARVFDIDARVMTGGRPRAELSPADFARYVAECRSLLDEYTAIRERMHNGE